MGDIGGFEAELMELNKMLREIDNIKIIKNIELLVKDYMSEKEKATSIS